MILALNSSPLSYQSCSLATFFGCHSTELLWITLSFYYQTTTKSNHFFFFPVKKKILLSLAANFLMKNWGQEKQISKLAVLWHCRFNVLYSKRPSAVQIFINFGTHNGDMCISNVNKENQYYQYSLSVYSLFKCQNFPITVPEQMPREAWAQS